MTKIKNPRTAIVHHSVVDKVCKFEVYSYDTEKGDRFCAHILFKFLFWNDEFANIYIEYWKAYSLIENLLVILMHIIIMMYHKSVPYNSIFLKRDTLPFFDQLLFVSKILINESQRFSQIMLCIGNAPVSNSH